MLLINLILGLFLIGMGFLIKLQPNLIAGYNTMSKEKKKDIDIEGLSTFMRNWFIIMGSVIIICSVLFNLLNWERFTGSLMLFVILTGAFIIIIRGRKYNHNEKKKNTAVYIIITVAFFMVIGGILYSDSLPAKIIFDEDKIEFKGSYGFNLNFTDIESFEFADEIPDIERRTNGLSIGNVKKGFFRLESWGKCRLLLESNQPPFLIITKKNGEIIIINNKDKSTTEKIYKQIELSLNYQTNLLLKSI